MLTDLDKMTTEELILALSDIVYGRIEDSEEASATLYEIVDELELRCSYETELKSRPGSKVQ